jgi:sorting and assembly machinery component 37
MNTAEQDSSKSGGRSLASNFEAAKKDAGIPTQPKVLSMGRKAGIQGLLSSPIYAARFKLDNLSNELLEPLASLLGKKDYLLEGGKPSSLDCLAFGYLALMFYPPVPQAWLKEALQARFPRLVSYIGRMRDELLGSEDVKAADVWSLSSRRRDDADIESVLHNLGLHLPWRPPPSQSLYLPVVKATQEIVNNLPLVSTISKRPAIIQADSTQPAEKARSSLPSPFALNVFLAFSAAATAAIASIAIHHRRSPREGDLIFWALRPQPKGLGEAGNILSVLANQLAMPQPM